MPEFDSFLKAATHCAEMAVAQHEATHNALERATRLLQRKAKQKFGEYQEQAGQFVAWAELADSTQDQRERAGYEPDEPLLRDGTLREGIQRLVKDGEGYVGSNDDVMVYQELGTKNMPPRSVLGATGVENVEGVVKIVGQSVVMALVGEYVFEGSIDILEWSAKP